MAYAIDLVVALQSDYALYDELGFRITITAVIPVGGSTLTSLSNNSTYAGPHPSDASGAAYAAASVFRYVRKPARPDGVVEDVFSGVCSWPDYVELPMYQPEVDTMPANFRTNYIDLVVESETVANEIWSLVKTQVGQLMQTISNGQVLVSGTTFSISI
jgi:hypothetical protein